MTAQSALILVKGTYPSDGDVEISDREALLEAALSSASGVQSYRGEVIEVAPDDPHFGWKCDVGNCWGLVDADRLCKAHYEMWVRHRSSDGEFKDWIAKAASLKRRPQSFWSRCEKCASRLSHEPTGRLCIDHLEEPEKIASMPPQEPFCAVPVCPEIAENYGILCPTHVTKYYRGGHPGACVVRSGENGGRQVGIYRQYQLKLCLADSDAFEVWCSQERPKSPMGAINLRGLPVLVRLEIEYALYLLQLEPRSLNWTLSALNSVAAQLRADGVSSVFDYWQGTRALAISRPQSKVRRILRRIVEWLRPLYVSRGQTRSQGYIELAHHGNLEDGVWSYYDLRIIQIDWIREMAWDYMVAWLRSDKPPRTRVSLDNCRRGLAELAAFIADRKGSSVEPGELDSVLAEQFVDDLTVKARSALPSRVVRTASGKPTKVSFVTRRFTLSNVRRVFRWAVETEESGWSCVNANFVYAIPYAGRDNTTPRRPLSDEQIEKLSSEDSLAALDRLDPTGIGYRLIWQIIFATGRRMGEVVKLRWDCIFYVGEVPMLEHDQTKVARLASAIQIPERLAKEIESQQRRVVEIFFSRHRREPSSKEKAQFALFPTSARNIGLRHSLSVTKYSNVFREWVTSLDMKGVVTHQARHTLATRLLRAGANTADIQRYLGHISPRMTQHYLHYSQDDLASALAAVWVAGPGAAEPGRTVSPAAKKSAGEVGVSTVDLVSSIARMEGGSCTYQPFVSRGSCMNDLDCGGCPKYVLTGGDLLYWRRKREQWDELVQAAPNAESREYLRDKFKPFEAAIAGLERVLEERNLLDAALKVDLRVPQNNFSRVWRASFRFDELVEKGRV